MRPLTRQMRSELRKWTTLRSSWAVAAAAVAADLLLKTISMVLVKPDSPRVAADTLFALRPSILHPVLLCALGVLLAATEWRHRTAVPTYTVQPRRGLVLAAKAGCAALTGLATAAVATGVSDAVALAVAHQRSLPVPTAGETARIVAGSVAGGAVLAVLGVALGTWLTSQVGALAAAAGVFLALGPVAVLVDPRFYAVLPGGALDSLAAQRAANPDLLTVPVAVVLLVGYLGVLLVVANRVVGRRPVT